jgi:UDP-glucose 4-epimerase
MYSVTSRKFDAKLFLLVSPGKRDEFMSDKATKERTKRWLITGGCGFIGGILIRRLVSEQQHVRVVDDLSVGSLAALGDAAAISEGSAGSFGDTWSGVQFIRSSVLDATVATAAATGADVIVHLAANTGVGPSIEAPREDCETNVIGIFNYLEAAREKHVKRFVFASSGAPLGNCEPPLSEELAPRPLSPYGASKLAGEGYCSAYFHSFGVEAVSLRFGNVFGPGSAHKESVVAKFIRSALADEPLEIFGDGQQTRDFIYVDDVVEAISLAAAKQGIGGETFQIATARERTVGEIAKLIVDLMKVHCGKSIEIKHALPRIGDAQRNFSDTTKARDRLGFVASQDTQGGLINTLEYLLDHANAQLQNRN